MADRRLGARVRRGAPSRVVPLRRRAPRRRPRRRNKSARAPVLRQAGRHGARRHRLRGVARLPGRGCRVRRLPVATGRRRRTPATEVGGDRKHGVRDGADRQCRAAVIRCATGRCLGRGCVSGRDLRRHRRGRAALPAVRRRRRHQPGDRVRRAPRVRHGRLRPARHRDRWARRPQLGIGHLVVGPRHGRRGVDVRSGPRTGPPPRQPSRLRRDGIALRRARRSRPPPRGRAAT